MRAIFGAGACERRRGALVGGLSLALHLAVFVALPGWQTAPLPAPLPLFASLRPAPAAEVPVPEALPPAAASRTASSAPRSTPPAAPRLSVPGPASPAPAASPLPVASIEPALPVERPFPAVAALPSPPEPVARPVQAVDPLVAYRLRLAELFARQQDYPRIAAMRGWEGEVRLRLKVARKGNLLGVVVDRSSGFDVLDQHALAMLAGLGSLPPIPDTLESSEIQVVVPIHYKLNKTT